MTRRYRDYDDLIHDLDANDSLADDPFGEAFDDEDLAILASLGPENPRSTRRTKPAPRRGRPKKA